MKDLADPGPATNERRKKVRRWKKEYIMSDFDAPLSVSSACVTTTLLLALQWQETPTSLRASPTCTSPLFTNFARKWASANHSRSDTSYGRPRDLHCSTAIFETYLNCTTTCSPYSTVPASAIQARQENQRAKVYETAARAR